MAASENCGIKSLSVFPKEESIGSVSDFFDICIEEYEIPMKTGVKVKIIADEIYSNIVYYSGANNAEMVFYNSENTIMLRFVDDGIAYNPMEAKEPDISSDALQREVGGLGLFMVRKMAEDIQYEYSDSKNKLTVVLSKTIPDNKTKQEDV